MSKDPEIGISLVLLKALKIVIDFEHGVITWEGSQILMNGTKLTENKRKQLNAIFQPATEPKTVHQVTARVTNILDAQYERANLADVVENIVATSPRRVEAKC